MLTFVSTAACGRTRTVTYQGRIVGYATREKLRAVVAERGTKVVDTVDRWMTVFPRQVRTSCP